MRAHISQPPAAGSSHLISSHRMSGHVMPVRLAVTFASRKVTSRRPSVHLMEVPSGEPPPLVHSRGAADAPYPPPPRAMGIVAVSPARVRICVRLSPGSRRMRRAAGRTQATRYLHAYMVADGPTAVCSPDGRTDGLAGEAATAGSCGVRMEHNGWRPVHGLPGFRCSPSSLHALAD